MLMYFFPVEMCLTVNSNVPLELCKATVNFF